MTRPIIEPHALNSQWETVRPITLALSHEIPVDWYIASDNFTTVYGDGETAADAIRDYESSLAEYAELVERGAAEGDRFDAAELTRLGEYVRRIKSSGGDDEHPTT